MLMPSYPPLSDFRPGDKAPDIEMVQRALVTLRHMVPITGVYDAATDMAVVGFRYEMGLPIASVIDDEFTDSLYAEMDKRGDTSLLPPDVGMTGGRTTDIDITGRPGKSNAIWWAIAVFVAYKAVA